jgi:hypothetical protein
MFTWLNKQGVRSEEGFEVQSISRYEIEYREGRNVVTVHVEPGVSAGGPSLSVHSNAFSAWNHAVPIAPAEQARMRANFKAAMAFQGIAVE